MQPYMVVLKDFPINSAVFGLVSYNDLCKVCQGSLTKFGRGPRLPRILRKHPLSVESQGYHEVKEQQEMMIGQGKSANPVSCGVWDDISFHPKNRWALQWKGSNPTFRGHITPFIPKDPGML